MGASGQRRELGRQAVWDLVGTGDVHSGIVLEVCLRDGYPGPAVDLNQQRQSIQRRGLNLTQSPLAEFVLIRCREAVEGQGERGGGAREVKSRSLRTQDEVLQRRLLGQNVTEGNA